MSTFTDFAKAAWKVTPWSAVAASVALTTPVAATMGAIGGTMYASGYSGYKAPGYIMMAGFDPHTVGTTGRPVYRGWGHELDFSKAGGEGNWYIKTAEAQAVMDAGEVFSMKGLKAFAPGNPIGLGMNLMMLAQGYHEGGVMGRGGLLDTLALNSSIEASVYKWSYGIGTAKMAGGDWLKSNAKIVGSRIVMNPGSALFRGAGATIGGMIGQQAGLATGIPMAGSIGASVGAYIGGNPMGALAENPILTTGAVLGLVTAGASYGAYQIIKAGAQAGYGYRQSQRGVNTDGDMSAFMTQNAVTMRSRAVQSIQRSNLNARSALGMESSFLHSPKNYNSRYR